MSAQLVVGAVVEKGRGVTGKKEQRFFTPIEYLRLLDAVERLMRRIALLNPEYDFEVCEYDELTGETAARLAEDPMVPDDYEAGFRIAILRHPKIRDGVVNSIVDAVNRMVADGEVVGEVSDISELFGVRTLSLKWGTVHPEFEADFVRFLSEATKDFILFSGEQGEGTDCGIQITPPRFA